MSHNGVVTKSYIHRTNCRYHMGACKAFNTGTQSKSVALYMLSICKAPCAYFVTARLLILCAFIEAWL